MPPLRFISLFDGRFGTSPRPTRMGQQAARLGTLAVYSRTPPAVAAEFPQIRFFPFTPTGRPLHKKIQRRLDLGLHRFSSVKRNDAAWAIPLAPLAREAFDIILCHDLSLLPMAYALRNQAQNRDRAKIVMDLREYYPRQMESSLKWKLKNGIHAAHLCSCYLAEADARLTVSSGLAAEYENIYQASCSLLPSYSPFHKLQPLNSSDGPIRCIHHGGAQPNRKLELMIEAIRMLDGRVTLDFMLTLGNAEYLQKLQRMAQGIPWIRFLPTVPMQDIVRTIHPYDLGIYLLPDRDFNTRHALPNKLFEFIQARLGVVVSPVPDMSQLVRHYGVGTVTSDYTPQCLAETLGSLSREDILKFKNSANEAAKVLCWERNEEFLETLYEKLSHT